MQLLRSGPDIVLNFQLAPDETLPCTLNPFGGDGDEDDQPPPTAATSPKAS